MTKARTRTRLVGLREARAALSDLVREAQAGCRVILTDRGRPAVMLVAMDEDDIDVTPEYREELRRRMGGSLADGKSQAEVEQALGTGGAKRSKARRVLARFR